MRTTVDVDDDLRLKLRQLAHKRGTTFRVVLNEAIRRGLSAQVPARKGRTAFRVEPFRSAFRPGVDPLKLNALVDDLDVRDRLGPR